MQLAQVAAQLYTVREHCRTTADFATTAKKIRAIGYQAVQLSGLGPIPDEDLIRICGGEGLAICATHEPSDVLRTNPEMAIERLQRLGCRHTAYPFPRDVDFTDPAQLNRLIADLERAGALFQRSGLILSYHNHAIEFLRVRGALVLESIFTRTQPHHLHAELDTYWVQYGGGDPVAWCERLAGRLALLHLKDYVFLPDNKPTFAEIGAGNLDFPRIIAAAEKSGCRWFAVEQDTCPGDPFDSLQQSFRHIQAHLVTS